MSIEAEYSYELESQRRQEIYNERVRETTKPYYDRYRSMYEGFRDEDYDKFIPDDMERLKMDLDALNNALEDDPAEAREISFSIKDYIYEMRSLGRNAKKSFASKERIANAKALRETYVQRQNEVRVQSERYAVLENAFRVKRLELSNPAVQNFIADDLERIRKKLSEGGFETTESLENEFSQAVQTAECKVSEWKASVIKKHAAEIVKSKIEAEKELVSAQKFEDTEKKEVIIKTLDEILVHSSAGSTSAEEIKKEFTDIQKEVIDAVVSEAVRKEAVKSIIKALRECEFTVTPSRDVTIKDGTVRIVATQPSGKRAVYTLTNTGKLKYKFDDYEGMGCLKDIQKVNADLDKVYSVKLSDERVLWRNPDKIGKDADRIPSSGKIHG